MVHDIRLTDSFFLFSTKSVDILSFFLWLYTHELLIYNLLNRTCLSSIVFPLSHLYIQVHNYFSLYLKSNHITFPFRAIPFFSYFLTTVRLPAFFHFTYINAFSFRPHHLLRLPYLSFDVIYIYIQYLYNTIKLIIANEQYNSNCIFRFATDVY